MPVNAALCSFGMSGRVFHAPLLHANANFNLFGVVERSTKSASNLYRNIKSYNSIEEMLADDAVDLVVVNTPNHTHYGFVKDALNAGKHVIVEKPFVVNSKDGEELIKLAATKGLKLSVFHNRRWDSDFLSVSRIVKDRLLGEIVEAEFHYDRFKPTLSGKPHKEQPMPGAGLVYDLAPHLVDQALLLFGKPESIFADIALLRDVAEVDDYFEIIFIYHKLRVRLKASNLVKAPVPAYMLHGTKGSFIKHRTDVQEAALLKGEIPNKEWWGLETPEMNGMLYADTTISVSAPAGNYMHYYDEMYRAIAEDTHVPVSGEDALTVIKIMEASFASNEQKRVIQLAETIG